MGGFTDPGHLPNLRRDRRPRHPSWLPRQRRGTTPQMIGRYPDYDVLENAHNWDEATRRCVLARLEVPPLMRFFAAGEEPALRAFCDVATGQDADPRVPVAEVVDHRLADGTLDGYQYAGMPDDREVWRIVLAGLDEIAQGRHRAGFHELAWDEREAIVGQLAGGVVSGGAWERVDPGRAFKVCMRYVLGAFYSHPWAWNEIGFGGPAYPLGFMRLGGIGVLEPHERPGATVEDPVRVARAMEP